jgi:hypothetical protein
MVLTTLRQEVESESYWLIVPSRKEPSLAGRIQRALRATGYPALRTIDVSVRWSVVVLRDRVSSYEMKQMAHGVALAVPGVWELCNDVEVNSLALNRSYQRFKILSSVEEFHDCCQKP